MPTYLLENLNSGETEEHFCKWSEVEALVQSGKYKLLPSVANIVSGVGTTVGRIDNGFNDVLKGIKKANRGSNINTK